MFSTTGYSKVQHYHPYVHLQHLAFSVHGNVHCSFLRYVLRPLNEGMTEILSYHTAHTSFCTNAARCISIITCHQISGRKIQAYKEGSNRLKIKLYIDKISDLCCSPDVMRGGWYGGRQLVFMGYRKGCGRDSWGKEPLV